MAEYYLCSKADWQKFGQRFLHISNDSEACGFRREFFEACKDKERFLSFIQENLKYSPAEDAPPVINTSLTEKEFIKPPEKTQKKVYDTYKNISGEYVHNPSFWFCVICGMIKKDIIKPSFLASKLHSNKLAGKQNLDKLTNLDISTEDNEKDCNKEVRRILRRLCNTEPRGKRTLVRPSDCSISAVYWRQFLLTSIEKASKKQLTLEVISMVFDTQLYEKICERLFSGKSYYGDPKVLAGLVLFLQQFKKENPEAEKQEVENLVEKLLEEIGKVIAWKAVDLLSSDEIMGEFKALYEANKALFIGNS